MPTPREQAAHDTLADGMRFVASEAGGLRSRTARGTVVNGAFLIGTNGLTVIQGVVVAALLPVGVYGRWGLLMAAFMTLLALGSIGIDDKYIQQDDADQRRAFEVAFTLQVLLGAVFFVVLTAGMPAFALLYGQTDLIAPGLVLALAIPALVLQMPLWAHYRRMDFLRQRTLQLVDPVVTFVVTVGLALAHQGIWALVVGALTGTWVASACIVWQSPYRLRLRWEPAAFREYLGYSWPLFGGALSTAVVVQAPVTLGARVLGLRSVAGLALANSISLYATHVDGVITQTIYPAICAVKDRPDLLFETFWKSNRLALLWAAPLGAAAALFAGDFVHLVIGEKWRFAVPLIAVYGVNAALNQAGFNWTAFFMATGDTRPVGLAGFLQLVAVLVVAVPLLVVSGITAFGIGMAAVTLFSLALRRWFLRRIFPGRPVGAKVVGGILPAIPAAAAVLALRGLDPGGRTVGRVAAEALLFGVLTLATTWFTQRTLLRESAGYLRRVRPAAAAATSPM